MSTHEHIGTTLPDAVGPFADDTLDNDDDWDVAPPPKRRMHWTTLLLALAVAGVLAFGGGILAEKHWGKTSSAAGFTFPGGGSLPAGFPQSLAAAAGSGGATTGLPGLGGNSITGTVSYVQGATLYVSTATGTVTKVVVPKGLSVTRTISSPPASIRPGEAVVVQGKAARDGAVRATGVTVTAR